MDRLVEETGFKSFTGKSTCFKVTWISLILLMCLSFGFETYKILRLYTDWPTSTVISYEKKTIFPPVTICTNDWIDPTALDSLGITDPIDEFFFLGPMCPSVRRPTHFPKLPRDFNYTDGTRSKFRSAEDQEGGYSNLLKQLAVNFNDIGTVHCTSCMSMNIQATPVIKEEGVCWLFEPGEVSMPTTRMFRNPTLIFDFKYSEGDKGLNPMSKFNIFLSEAAKDSTATHHASAVSGMTNVIDVSLTDMKRAVNCNKTEGHTMAACDIYCFSDTEAMCDCPCYAFSGEVNHSGKPVERRSTRVCNWGDSKEMETCSWECFKMNKDVCRPCYPPCEGTDVAVSAMQLNELPENVDARIEIRIRNPFKMLRFHEYFSYTFTSLLSDFGGLSGFFIGFSVISIAQFFIYCFCLPCSRSKSGEKSENE